MESMECYPQSNQSDIINNQSIDIASSQHNKPAYENELEECKRLLDSYSNQGNDLGDFFNQQCRHNQEDFILLYQNRSIFERNHEVALRSQNPEAVTQCEHELKNFDENLKVKASELTGMREDFKHRQQQLYYSLDQVQWRVIWHVVADWKRRQQLAGNGANFDNNLDQIQVCCELLMSCLWNNRRLLKTMEMSLATLPINFNMGALAILIDSYTKNIKSLLTETFVLEKQPPQVMKTNTRFMATVRSLCGNSLNIHTLSPEVNVKIISEQQANHFQYKYLKNDFYRHYSQQQMYALNYLDPMNQFDGQMNNFNQPLYSANGPNPNMPHVSDSSIGYNLNFSNIDTSGEILNGSGRLESQQKDGQLGCNFRNMQLKKIKRAEKKGSESVMDEKFTLLFHTKHIMHDLCADPSNQQELILDIWAMSSPVVVIVHGNQEPHAWATVTWDNAFASPGRLPFKVPDAVYWQQLARVLSDKFESFCGRGLSETHLKFLLSKVLRIDLAPDMNHDCESITWSQFAKDPLGDRNFTFWEWFYSICKLTRDYLKPMWIDNRILGFASRKDTENLLLNAHLISNAQDNGTFLIRFSESELGGITVAWCHQNLNNNQREILMLQPFSHKDLIVRSLADRIKDVKQLLYLYPDVPKDVAFQAYYTPDSVLKKQNQNNHYLQPLLVQTIVNYPNSDCPATPASYVASTPEDIYQDNSSTYSQNIDTKYRRYIPFNEFSLVYDYRPNF